MRQKISLFCNVPYEAVVEEQDVEHTIYEVPLMLQRERMDELVCHLLHLDLAPANMAHWQEMVRKLIAPKHHVRIGVVGKYIGLQDAYKSVYEAISHGGIANDCGVQIQKVDAEDIERDGPEKHLKGMGGVLVPGGFGERGIEGKIRANVGYDCTTASGQASIRLVSRSKARAMHSWVSSSQTHSCRAVAKGSDLPASNPKD